MKKEDVKKKEDLKIQLDGQFDEDSKKLFSLFEKLINQSDIKNVIKFLEFVNKNGGVNTFMKEGNTQDKKVDNNTGLEKKKEQKEIKNKENSEYDKERKELIKRQESIKKELAGDDEYNSFMKKVLSKKIDVSDLEIEIYYLPYGEDTLDTKIWKVSPELINKKTTPLQFATYYKILNVCKYSNESLEDFIYSMKNKFKNIQNDKKLFEKTFREHLSDVFFLNNDEQDVIIGEMKRIDGNNWSIDTFYMKFMSKLISREFLASQDEACFPESIEEIEILNKFDSFDDEYDEDEDYEEDDEYNDEDDEDEDDLEDDEDEDLEDIEKELQELKEKQKRVKEKLDNDKGFQDIIKKILSKKIDISQMNIRIHVIPYGEDTLDTKSLEVSQRIINSETTPLLFVTYLKILKVLQISPFDELEEFFSSMLKKLERYEFNSDGFKKKFREHLSDVYLLTKKEQDALLNTLAFGGDIEYAYDFYEYFMEEFVGKVYTSYMDEKCFPSSIEEIELVENNKSIRI